MVVEKSYGYLCLYMKPRLAVVFLVFKVFLWCWVMGIGGISCTRFGKAIPFLKRGWKLFKKRYLAMFPRLSWISWKHHQIRRAQHLLIFKEKALRERKPCHAPKKKNSKPGRTQQKKWKTQRKRSCSTTKKEIYLKKDSYHSWLLRRMYQIPAGFAWSVPSTEQHWEKPVYWGAFTFHCCKFCTTAVFHS